MGIAPFRAMIRHIHEKLGSWEGKVRRFYGAKTGLDMLYMNDANQDLRSTAISRPQGLPGDQPAPDAPVEPDKALAQDAAKVWEMVQAPGTHIYLAGADDLLHRVEDDLAGMAGSIAA